MNITRTWSNLGRSCAARPFVLILSTLALLYSRANWYRGDYFPLISLLLY